MSTVQIVAVVIGVILLLLLLFLVFWRRDLTRAEYTFTRIITALAVSCVAVILTGFLTIDIKGFIQAGGALAVFVIVYFYAPADMSPDQKWEPIAKRWRNLRNIYDDESEVNLDDVVRALSAVNHVAKELEQESTMLKPFKNEFAKDYLTLYKKLKSNKYKLEHENSTSDELLEDAAHRIAKALEK
jgi:hypothetical protein